MRLIRKLLLALVIFGQLIGEKLCCGQSSFIFVNLYPPEINAPVFDAEGNPLTGPNYVAMLYGGATMDSLAPATVQYSSTQIMSPEPFSLDTYRSGYFLRNGWVEIPTVPGGSTAWLQVVAWDARLGSDYESVVALGQGGYGESSIFRAAGGDPYATGVPIPPQPLYGLQSFSLVPEPATWALFALGVVAFWFMARRKTIALSPHVRALHANRAKGRMHV